MKRQQVRVSVSDRDSLLLVVSAVVKIGRRTWIVRSVSREFNFTGHGGLSLAPVAHVILDRVFFFDVWLIRARRLLARLNNSMLVYRCRMAWRRRVKAILRRG